MRYLMQKLKSLFETKSKREAVAWESFRDGALKAHNIKQSVTNKVKMVQTAKDRMVNHANAALFDPVVHSGLTHTTAQDILDARRYRLVRNFTHKDKIFEKTAYGYMILQGDKLDAALDAIIKETGEQQ